MKRREFVAASCLAGLAPISRIALADSGGASQKEYYELRLYRLDSQDKQDALVEFLGKAAIPALNGIGVKPVGVFTLMDEENPNLPEEDKLNLYVLMPHKSLESVVTATGKLLADDEFLKAGASVLDATKPDPAYTRIESSLMLAFDEIPRLEIPSKKKTRVFQLRTYESHSVKKGQRKIEMFNGGGEIDVFRRTGLSPVFFGETLIGNKFPNLTYMIGSDDMEANEAAWTTFKAHPDWQKLRTDPYYKDTVSNITNIFLKPAACSQI